MVFGMKVAKEVEKTIDVLVIAGALNWGLTIFNLNLVNELAKLVNLQIVATLIYGVVGIAGLYKLLELFDM